MRFQIGSLIGPKHTLLNELLEYGKVMVHLDARRDGVEVPRHFRVDSHLRLNLSHHFGYSDFVVDESSARCSLSFGGQPFFCVLPWSSVFAMTSHREPLGFLWPEDLPPELANSLEMFPVEAPTAAPKLHMVSTTQAPEAADIVVAGAERPVASGKQYGHLRVVK